jgi:hypothetical protein
MGRSFASVRQHATDITDRWGRSLCPVPQMDQSVMQLAGMAKSHSGEAFFGCDDPLEPVLFSALVEIRKLQAGDRTVVDP